MKKEKIEARKMGKIWIVESEDLDRLQVEGFPKLPRSGEVAEFQISYSPNMGKLSRTTNDWNGLLKQMRGEIVEDPSIDTEVRLARDAGEEYYRDYYFYRGEFVADRFCDFKDFLGRSAYINGNNFPPKDLMKKYDPAIKLLEERVGRALINR